MEKCYRKFKCLDCGHTLIVAVFPSETEIMCPSCCEGIMYKQDCSHQCGGKCYMPSDEEDDFDHDFWPNNFYYGVR
jgi:hypothetical protein